MTKSGKLIFGIIGFFALAAAAGAIWYFTSFQIVKVPTTSMANTILPGDHVLCTKKAGKIERGDIVLFKYPPEPKVQYLMRVIGMPGESIQLRGAGVLINGEEMTEAKSTVDLGDGKSASKELSTEGTGKYRASYVRREPNVDYITGAKYAVEEPFQIPAGNYFVMGDSRDNSHDSRFWGTVPAELITGKALMIVGSDAPQGGQRTFTKLN